MNYPKEPLLNIARGTTVPTRVIEELTLDGYLTVDDDTYTFTPQAMNLLNTTP